MPSLTSVSIPFGCLAYTILGMSYPQFLSLFHPLQRRKDGFPGSPFRSSTSNTTYPDSPLSQSTSSLAPSLPKPTNPNSKHDPSANWPPAFYLDFTSRVWLTYHSQFPNRGLRPLFLDTPSPEAPFRVHRMALAGKELGTDVGQWFGQSVAAGGIRSVNIFSLTHTLLILSQVFAALTG